MLTEHQKTVSDRLCHTLETSVSPYHCVMEAENQLAGAGFIPLSFDKPWTLKAGESYWIKLFDSTLFAFSLGKKQNFTKKYGLRLASAHTDWPCFKLKPCPEIMTDRYEKLNVEGYGSPILSTWMDRPLSAAGKVGILTENPFEPEIHFFSCRRPLFTIPSLAIHMNREVNKGMAFNLQIDMLPLAGIMGEKQKNHPFFAEFLAEEIGCRSEDILDYELYLYNADTPQVLGLQEEFLSSPRLDNITSVQACLTGLIESTCQEGIHGIILYDNEEIGSSTKQGAKSMLMERILEKLYLSLGLSREELAGSLLNGIMLSLDVAHAMHPNHQEKCDIKNQIVMGDGIALKLSSSQSYATDASYISIIEALCRKNQIPYRKFSNRSDIRGGSTLGSISSAMLNIPTVDAGIPMLAMHSAREIIHIRDQEALERLTAVFFQE